MSASPPGDLKDGAAFAARLAAIYEPATLEVVGQPNPWVTFWANPLRPGTELPRGEPVPGAPGLFMSADREAVTHSAAAGDGCLYVQNPSSWLAACVVDPQPGDEVLDLAAAPGGKTIAMAAAMANEGRIAAVEPVPARFHRLRANLDRCGVTIAALYQKDGRGVGRLVPERFDRVLLDAPCSSEARMRWDEPASYRHWSLRKVRETSRKQKRLLRSAYAALKPGGVLVYCTCSFSPEENELVVQQLLAASDAALLPVLLDEAVPAMPALTTWQGKALSDELAHAVRVLPAAPWEGFFLARLTKPA